MKTVECLSAVFFVRKLCKRKVYLPTYHPKKKKGIMKRIYLLFILMLAVNLAFANNQNIDLEKRTTFYKIGMEMSIKYYDSLLHTITIARYKKQLGEQEYISTYKQAKEQYEEQQQIVAKIAESLANKDIKRTKAIKKSLDALAKKHPKEAIETIRKSCRKSGNVDDYIFKSDLEKILGRHDEALKTIEKIKSENDDYIIEYARELHFNGQDSFARIYCEKAIKNAANDTLKIVKAKWLLSEIMSIEYAAAPLIEAEYLLENHSKNPIETKQFLAATQHKLALIYLSKSEIENAFRVSEKSVKNSIGQDFEEKIMYKQTLAIIYKTAGANDKALFLFEELNKEYPKYVTTYSELYLPKYVAMLDEYGNVLKYYDKLKEFDELLRIEVEKRSELLHENYPFFVLGYIENINQIAQKYIHQDVKIFLAEDQWMKANDEFKRLEKTDVMLYGNAQCKILYKLASIQFALKKLEKAKVFFDQSLAIREYLYTLAPTENKNDLTEILMFISKVNIMLNNKEVGLQQLDRAIEFLKDIEVKGGNDKLEELKKYRKEIAN